MFMTLFLFLVSLFVVLGLLSYQVTGETMSWVEPIADGQMIKYRIERRERRRARISFMKGHTEWLERKRGREVLEE